ncbi:hypothetical protein CRENBAI_022632 [Crenichthys baileyi]|uniref:Secreted protein n=1 Tax=Crenichthys baileyi TaxID=28760 RepID=A0AAV9RQ88_9TELE
MTWITHLVAVEDALLPACLCMKSVNNLWLKAGVCEDEDDDDVCVFAPTLNVFLSGPGEILGKCLSVFASVCVCTLTFEPLARGVDAHHSDGVHKRGRRQSYVCRCLRARQFG